MDEFCAKSTKLCYNCSKLFGLIRITFQSRKMPRPHRIHNWWLYCSLVSRMNIQNIRPTTTIRNEKKSTDRENPCNAAVFLQIAG